MLSSKILENQNVFSFSKRCRNEINSIQPISYRNENLEQLRDTQSLFLEVLDSRTVNSGAFRTQSLKLISYQHLLQRFEREIAMPRN
jgi:hypothetical protein